MATKVWVGTDTGNGGKWGTAANWSQSGVPVNSDDVYLINSSQAVTGDLDQSAVTLDSLNIAQSFTGAIAADGTFLQIGATKVRIGYHDGPGSPSGSGRIKLDLGSAQSAVTIENSAANGTDQNKPPIRIICNHASTTFEISKGKVGIAYEPGDSALCASINTRFRTQPASDAEVYVGAGTTCPTVKIWAGKHTLAHAVTTGTVYGGELTVLGTGALTTLNVEGGLVNLKSSGTISTLNIDGGLVDLTKSATARTVTTCTLDKPGAIEYDPAVITFTNKIISSNKVQLTAS